MQPIVAEVRGRIPAVFETVFDVFAQIDPTTILSGHRWLPEVVAVEDQMGDWSEIGESRVLRLADGSGMLETLTAFDRPYHFETAMSELTSSLRYLISSFRGAWFFELANGTGPDAIVHVRWRYEFVPRSILTRPLARWIVSRHWQPYMERALELASEEAMIVARAD